MAVTKTSSAAGGRGVGGESGSRCIQGLDLVLLSVPIAVADLDTGDDVVLVYKFPDDGDVWLMRFAESIEMTVTDMDSGTDSDIDLVIDNDGDGGADTILINSASGGQAAATFRNAVASPLDVSGKYLALYQNTTAAGFAAGTITISFLVAFGKKYDSLSLS
jgi:hypothetical protein